MEQERFEVVDVLTVLNNGQARPIELCFGDLAALPPEHAVDVLVLSALPDAYVPTPRSLIWRLEQKRGISVAALARRKAVDLRGTCSCWMSEELVTEEDPGFRRLLCFEPHYRGDPASVVGDIFRSLIPFLEGSSAVRTVAMPIVSTGLAGVPVSEMLPPLIEAVVKWMTLSLALERLKIVIYSLKQRAEAAAIFRSLKQTYGASPPPAPGRWLYDFFVSYAHRDAEDVERLEAELLCLQSDLRIFRDRKDLAPGVAWAMSIGGEEHVVRIDDQSRMPSMVFLPEGSDGDPGGLLVGQRAEDAGMAAPERFEPSLRRRFGEEFVLLGSERVRVTDAVGQIFKYVLEAAAFVRGGEKPSELRLTHPPRWGGQQLEKLREAAATVGFEHPLLVAEPVATAVYYADERLSQGEHVAVYDLGGGKFETTVLQLTENGFEIVGSPGCNDKLGGEDFDNRLYRFLGAQIEPERWSRFTSADISQRAHYQFKSEVRDAKERLSQEPEAAVWLPAPVERELTISRPDFEDLIREDIESTVDEVERAIRSAGQTVESLSAIYLAGASSRIPLVLRMIVERLGMQPSSIGDPKSVIALGAIRVRPPHHAAPAAAPLPPALEPAAPESSAPQSARDS
jgi:hypothetical protein